MLLTVAIPTYNRCTSLAATLHAVQTQRIPEGISLEILVVDNNSNDATRETVQSAAAADPRVRYCFEARQGLSPARNRALAEARGEWIAWTDDDIQPAPGWIESIVAVTRRHPDWALFGGRVLPQNQHRFPAWLDPGHYAPLALLDRGPEPRPLGHDYGFVVGANMAVHTAQARRIGPFSETLGRVGHSKLGSMEDEDYVQRFLDAGLPCFYDPSLVVYTGVQSERLRPYYHWRWHFGHGHHWAIYRQPAFEKSYRARFGVPGHVYRQGLVNLLGLPFSLFSPSRLMVRINLILWSAGFIAERFRQNCQTARSSTRE